VAPQRGARRGRQPAHAAHAPRARPAPLGALPPARPCMRPGREAGQHHRRCVAAAWRAAAAHKPPQPLTLPALHPSSRGRFARLEAGVHACGCRRPPSAAPQRVRCPRPRLPARPCCQLEHAAPPLRSTPTEQLSMPPTPGRARSDLGALAAERSRAAGAQRYAAAGNTEAENSECTSELSVCWDRAAEEACQDHFLCTSPRRLQAPKVGPRYKS